jgi:ABC-type transporter Mla subunit MlaD
LGFGDALSGRGADLNDTLHSLPGLLGELRPVAASLSDPSTELTRFLETLNRLMAALVPVAQTGGRLFGELATTFAAKSRASSARLEATINRSPAPRSPPRPTACGPSSRCWPT